MSVAAQPTARVIAQLTPHEQSRFASKWGLLAAAAALIVILLLPTPAGLPVGLARLAR